MDNPETYDRQVLAAAERWPDAVAVRDEHGVETTLADLVAGSVRAGHGLGALGLEPGGVYAVLAMNSLSYINLWHAALMTGAVINPLNMRLAPAELRFLVQDSGATVLFADSTFLPLARQIVDGLDPAVTVVALDGDGATSWPDVLADADSSPLGGRNLDEPAFIIYTGGTTGRPKGARHKHRSAVRATAHLEGLFGYDESSVFLSFMPMFHVAAAPTIWGLPLVGGTARLAMPDPAANVAQVAEGITHLSMPPALLQAMWAQPDCRPDTMSTVRSIGYGGAPMPVPLLEELLADYSWIDLFQLFGMTETAAVLTALTAADHRKGGAMLRSVGRPMPGSELQIVGDDDNPLPTGEVGEVVVKADWLLDEYVNQPDLTEEAFRGGWFHTGDVGSVDDEGYLTLVDRKKDMIITGAENVYSVEVESALETHPDVQEVAVIGVPSEQWGEQVHAVIVTAKPELTLDDLRDHARGSIGGYKLPKSVEVRSEPLPRTVTGKVRKTDLRAPHWEGHDRQIS